MNFPAILHGHVLVHAIAGLHLAEALDELIASDVLRSWRDGGHRDVRNTRISRRRAFGDVWCDRNSVNDRKELKKPYFCRFVFCCRAPHWAVCAQIDKLVKNSFVSMELWDKYFTIVCRNVVSWHLFCSGRLTACAAARTKSCHYWSGTVQRASSTEKHMEKQ